jgi:hypothetical protein
MNPNPRSSFHFERVPSICICKARWLVFEKSQSWWYATDIRGWLPKSLLMEFLERRSAVLI